MLAGVDQTIVESISLKPYVYGDLDSFGACYSNTVNTFYSLTLSGVRDGFVHYWATLSSLGLKIADTKSRCRPTLE